MSIFGKYDSISYDEDTSDIDLQNSTSNTFAWDVQYDEDMDEDADEEIDGYANVDPNIDAIDQLWSLVGLHDIKSRFYDIKAKVDVAGRQKMRLENEKFNAVFMGNPGTGMLQNGPFLLVFTIYLANSPKGNRRFFPCTINSYEISEL